MQIKITQSESHISVVSPYSAEYVSRARDLGGKWDAGSKAWRFPLALKDDVLKILDDCYGYVADRSQERVTLKITVHCGLSEGKGPVKIGPYELANARGRDSGARPGPNVALLSGSINSGGSVKNWQSHVFAGAVFKITDVPLSVAERLREIAVAAKHIEYDAVDAIERTAPAGQHYWSDGFDDGLPEGLRRRPMSKKGPNGETLYRWMRPVERADFTVEEV